MIARQITCEIFADGENVSSNLAPYITEVSYEDNAGGEADTASITLHDVERLFISDWMPKRGITVSITLYRENWKGDNQYDTLPLGNFELDEIELSFPPSVARCKLNSISQNSALRQHDESQSWEDVKLSQIANDVASKAGVKLCYETTEDPVIKRAEQAEKSSLAFLKKLCTDNGLALKVSDQTLIIFDETKLEEQEPIARFTRDVDHILRFSAQATLQDVYKDCEVSYRHGQKSETFKGSFTAPDKTEGKTLKINQRVDSQEEADKLARKSLRDKNKKETTCRITTAGDFRLLSGNVIELIDYGQFSGRYLIEKSTHKVSNGYTVDLELRKCLNGY